MLSLLAGLLLNVQAGPALALSADSAEALRKAARRAETQYESLARRLIPRSFGAGSSGSCDEVVGRFCLTYDPPGQKPPPPKPEDPKVTQARRTAADAYRRAFNARPGDVAVAMPLVRFLVEDGATEEAVTAARRFHAASSDPAWGPLLTAFALHAAGAVGAAEPLFEQAFAALGDKERRRAGRSEVLLAPPERAAYRKLSEAERARYDAWLWRLADALYMTSGNETRTEHYARYVWARILEKAPVVSSSTSWGSDLEELMIRYGVPRSRSKEDYGALGESRLIERYDPASVALVPDALRTRGPARAPEPGAPGELENERSRTAHAPHLVRRIAPMPHQLTRFYAGDTTWVRVDAVLPLDSTARVSAATARTALFLTDSVREPARIADGSATAWTDTIRFTLLGATRLRSFIYSAEAIETNTRLAGRARYPLAAPARDPDAPLLSDILLTQPLRGYVPASRADPALSGSATLLFERGATLGVYAEVAQSAAGAPARDTLAVELVVNGVDSPSAPVSALRWLGRMFGRSEGSAGARMTWRIEPSADIARIAVDVSMASRKPGLYEMTLAVSSSTGSRSESVRQFRVLD